MNKDEEAKFRRELEEAGEASVRADFYGGGGLSTGGEDRRAVVRKWLREKEQAREQRDRATLWIAVATLIAAVTGVYLGWIHK